MRQILGAVVCATMAASVAQADMAVRFEEGAPKDRFVFENASACAIEGATLLLDLSGSAAGLIFDVTGSGAGVEVYQPLEIVAGSDALVAVPRVRDGENRVTFDLRALEPGARLAFTIDVDDTLGSRAITVSNSEIAGARVALVSGDDRREGAFVDGPVARVAVPGCEARAS